MHEAKSENDLDSEFTAETVCIFMAESISHMHYQTSKDEHFRVR
jgi:hypothetical protein